MAFDGKPGVWVHTHTTPKGVLERAIGRIEAGWTQGEVCNDVTGAVCMLGALRGVYVDGFMLRRAEEDLASIHGAQQAVQKIIGREIALWNDQPTRTKAEVITALRTAVEIVDAV